MSLSGFIRPNFSLTSSQQIRITALLCLLPVFAAVAANLLSRFGWTVPRIVLLCTIALSPFALLYLDRPFQSIGLYAVSLALLLQNTLVDRNLSGGDAWMEYTLGTRTLQYGWDSTAATAHNQLIRLTLGHPITSLVTGQDLRMVLRIAHPLSMAALPVGILVLTRRIFSDRVAILSAVLYIFLHPFFFRISRDTRTGGALLMFVLCIFCVWRLIGDTAHRRAFSATALLLALGTIGSHEAVTVMGVGMLAFAVVGARFTKDGLDLTVLFLFASIMVYLWYNSFAGGTMFQTIVGVSAGAITGLLGAGGVSKAAASASADLQSFTYLFIRLSVISIFGLAGVGYLIQLLSYYRSRTPPLPYLGFLGGGFLILAAAFSPISTIGIVRPVALVAMFVLPLFILIIVRHIGIQSEIVAGGLCVLLLINAGVAGAYLGERTPQPHLQRGEIDRTASLEYFHLRSTWTTDAEIVGSRWLYRHSKQNTPIYTPTGAGGFSPHIVTPADSTERSVVDLGCQFKVDGYLYLNAYATHTGTVALRSPSYFSAIHAPINLSGRTTVYTNGDSTVTLTQGDHQLC